MNVKEESFKKVLNNGDIEYRNRGGELHREDGPAIEYVNGHKEWLWNGKNHREDGPAIEWASGIKDWYINGKLHREDGPAVEYTNGDKFWYINGKRHREDGPAIEFVNGDKEWWVNDVELSEKEFLKWWLKNSKTFKLNFQ